MKPFRIKRSIEIKGNKWTIKRVKGHHAETQEAGVTDPDTKTIIIDSKYKGEELERIFFHELNHAINFELHLLEANGITEFQSEVIAEGFTDVYRKLFKINWR